MRAPTVISKQRETKWIAGNRYQKKYEEKNSLT